jgi:alkanesulfonate monooxygenase SsuD/methylene tetrahydromethanopterin reductase-like flavin-dependent oxidoreductase (luciferase family)
MRVGIVLPTRGLLLNEGPPSVELLTRLARQAEEFGCDSVWVGDSLVAKPRLEPLTVLAAAAVATNHVRIGTAVLLAALRQPVLLAQAAATVDLLSGGRLTLGIGAGGAFTTAQQGEWSAAGVDLKSRGRRLTEVLEVIRSLWSGEAVTFNGRHFQLKDASLGFRPHQSPGVPLLLACHSGENRLAQYRRAARFASGLISITDSPDEFRQVRRLVLDEVEAAGRDPVKFSSTFYMTVNLNNDVDAASRESDAWVRAYYGVNYWGDRWGPYGTPATVLERARAYVAAGVDELIFRFAATDQERQLRLFGEAILPGLR